ncbi:MAG: hypothetical protein ACREX6_03340 [Casimicrobiaceae bacterium]
MTHRDAAAESARADSSRAAGTPPLLDAPTVAELRAVANRFTGSEAARKRTLLEQAAGSAPANAEVLLAWHDVLLFLLAYPEMPAMRAMVERELARVAEAARAIASRGGAGERRRLRGSGIAWSAITVAFSYPIVEWLVGRYPKLAEIDSFGERGDLLVAWFAHALPASEFALVESVEGGPDAAIDAGIDGWQGSRLAWLVDRFRHLPCDPRMAATLYESLSAFVVLRPGSAPISRSFARGLPGPIHYHREPLLRDVDVRRMIADALPPARRLQTDERLRLLETARGVLATLGRETDPITYADTARTRCHDLGRGVAIALYSAKAEWRPPLDSHVGYMLFKNAVPIAYGGGWPFLGTCRIGINIFAPFRGGESMFAMASILRAYAQLFAVEHFVVEPYQFGAGNREGLESGAFWFYYRLGFHPLDARLGELAATEFERMQRASGYRSPLAILRRFTRSDLDLRIIPDAARACDPVDLSRATSTWIGERFHGDRERAVAFAIERLRSMLAPAATERWNEHERFALRALAPVLAQIEGLDRWPARDRSRLAAMIRAKGGDEYRYFRLMAGFARLRSGLNAVAARPPAISCRRTWQAARDRSRSGS